MSEITIENVQELLNATSNILFKYESDIYETGDNFNIFKVANIESDERIICRILSDFLSPKGYHGQKSEYLKLFCRDCLSINLTDDELDKAAVYLEYPAKGRYIDIVIETPNRLIPIEVKIYAGDQLAQCYDYYNFAKKHKKNCNKNISLYYITRMGDPPSEASVTSYDKKDRLGKNAENDEECWDIYKGIIQLSFSSHIKNWLVNCMEIADDKLKPSLHEIIKQLINSTDNFTNNERKEMMNEIVEIIKANPDYVKTAAYMKDEVIPELRKVILRKIAEELKNKHDMKIFEEEKEDTIYYFFTNTNDSTILFQINFSTNTTNAIYAGFKSPKNTSPFYKMSYGTTINNNDDFFKLFEDEYFDKCIEKIRNYFYDKINEL